MTSHGILELFSTWLTATRQDPFKSPVFKSYLTFSSSSSGPCPRQPRYGYCS